MKKIGICLISLCGLAFIIPVVATVALSFMNDGKLSLTGYNSLLFDCFPFYTMFWNSIFYTVVITIGQLIIAVLFAFGFSQTKYKHNRIVFMGYIMLMMMPLQVTLLPNYIGLRDMGLLNTYSGIILPLIFSPFGVVVMIQYMKGIDYCTIEAARLESSSAIRIIISIVLPQLKVCIFAVGLFVYAECWNMLEQPMLFVKEEKYRTLSTFIASADKYTGDIMLPASVFFIIPVVILYLYFNEHLEKGLSLGDFS